ncbi:hypothetical protein [Candidatus Allofournierella merdipullorum]|uniref:hypothetical protein n=1 Tax=Candidatus Allofournierella merdipullorum TaxID=2838595 RepID=UPI00374EFBDE
MERFLKQCTRAALGVALAAVLLAGCAGQEAGQSASAPPMSESAAQTDGAAVEQLLDGEHLLAPVEKEYTKMPMAENKFGCYEFVGHGGGYLLCYTNYGARTRTPLCDAAGCIHRDESCPAFSKYYRTAVVAGDWLLTEGWCEENARSLDVRRLDGTERKELQCVDKEEDFSSFVSFAKEDGKLWMPVKGKAVLLDPATGEMEEGAAMPDTFYEVGVFGSSVLLLTDDKDALLKEYFQPTDDVETDLQSKDEILTAASAVVAAWDPRTGETVPLQSWKSTDYNLFGVWGTKIILKETRGTGLEMRDLVTGEVTALAENWPEDQSVSAAYVRDDHLMLETWWEPEPDNSDTWKECMFALDLESGELTEVTLRSQGSDSVQLPRILGGNENEFYVLCSSPLDFETRTCETAVISKADFYAGVDSMVPIKDVFR